ncbi:MAG: HPr family phosphocarrier protein [bacterium]
MKEGNFVISNKLGFHARAAAQFVKVANSYECEIYVYKNGDKANGKSILGLLTLAAGKGSTLRIVTEGKDEEMALLSLKRLIENKFGEE